MCGPRSLWLLLALAASGSGSQLQAQSVGDRVRVSASGTTFIGQVTAVSDEHLELSDGTRTMSLAFTGMSRLERSVGIRSRWKEGFVTGAYHGARVGGAVGLVFGALLVSFCDGATFGPIDDCSGAWKALGVAVLVGGVSLGVVGGLAGMGIGALFRTEAWTPIALGDTKIEYTPTIRPWVGPDGGLGLSFGVRLRF